MTPVHQLTPEQAVQELEQLEDQGLPANPKERQAHQARKDELTAWILMHTPKETPVTAPNTPAEKMETLRLRHEREVAEGKKNAPRTAWEARKLAAQHGLDVPPWAAIKETPLQSRPVRAVIADEVDDPPSLADLGPAGDLGTGYAKLAASTFDPVLDSIRDARANVWELLAKMERIPVKDRAAYLKELDLLRSATATAFLMAQGEVA